MNVPCKSAQDLAATNSFGAATAAPAVKTVFTCFGRLIEAARAEENSKYGTKRLEVAKEAHSLQGEVRRARRTIARAGQAQVIYREAHFCPI